MLTPDAGGEPHLHCSPSLADRRLFLRRTSSARTRHRSPDMCTIGDVFRLLLVSEMDVLLINNMVNSFSSFHSLFLFFIFCNLVERTFAIRFAACCTMETGASARPFHKLKIAGSKSPAISDPDKYSLLFPIFRIPLHFTPRPASRYSRSPGPRP